MDPWEVAAREAIRDLVARYNACGDAGRFDALLALFTPDAVVETSLGTCRGTREIRALFEGAAQRTAGAAGGGADAPGAAPPRARFVRHFTATHAIDVASPHEASGRCYYAVLTDRGLDHWGRYVDGYRCVDGRWLFARRRVTVDAGVPGGWGDVPA
ncbi:MAG: nuclear transport factor 2 family protein [Myxococcota bacterium]